MIVLPLWKLGTLHPFNVSVRESACLFDTNDMVKFLTSSDWQPNLKWKVLYHNHYSIVSVVHITYLYYCLTDLLVFLEAFTCIVIL